MDEHAYFRSIEERFIQLRGAPLLLTPTDYQVARRWWQAEIPIQLVHAVLEDLFARRAERGDDNPILSLRYCARAVESAWKRARQQRLADRREVVAPIEVGPRLEALAAAIPESLPGAERLRSRVRKLTGGAEEVEGQLGELDTRVLAAADSVLEAPKREALTRRVERGLSSLGRRLDGDALEEARKRLFEQALRNELGLPVLSLFTEP